MAALKKYKHHYPTDKKSKSLDAGAKKYSGEDQKSSLDDKKYIEAYQKKISKMLQDDPELQKKAALIISQLINSKK